MLSALNIQFIVVAFVIGTLLISPGSGGVLPKALQKKGNGHHKLPEDEDSSPSYRLILDPHFKPSPAVPRPINNDSISPWTYTFTQDENLYPSSIAEARCSLKGCLNMRGNEVHNFESKPIYTQILVLRRIRGDKHNYSFRLEYKTISVGCTCVRPYVEYV